MVVAAGLTAWVPPVAPREYEVPSEPARVTCAAFVAVMVRIDELPAVTDAGLAAMVIVGEGDVTVDTVTVEFALTDPPEPVAVAV